MVVVVTGAARGRAAAGAAAPTREGARVGVTGVTEAPGCRSVDVTGERGRA